MKKVVFVMLGWICISLPVQAGEFLKADRPLPGRYLVVLAPEAIRASNAPPTAPGRTVRQLMSELPRTYGGLTEQTFEHALRGGVVMMNEGQARALARDPRVAVVEEDHEIDAFPNVAVPWFWGVDRIDERNLPLGKHFNYIKTGAGVNLYIIDSGVAPSSLHFGSRLVNTYSTDRNAAGNMLFGDPVGHGTDVAIQAASAYGGVARGATVRAIRVTTTTCSPPGGGGMDPPAFAGTCFSFVKLIEAINWVTANRILPAVANFSLGGGVNSQFDAAVTGLLNAGVTVIAAAGNSNADACGVSPAHLSTVVTVGATTNSDARASFSNYGSCVTLFAPGADLYNGLVTVSGTSFAAPLAAGVAAQFLQGTPSASPAAVRTYLINNATTGKVTNPGPSSPNRLLFAPPGGTEIDNPPVANFTFSCSGLTCQFTSTSTDDFGSVSCGWVWDTFWDNPFDGQPRTGCNLSHTYPFGGTFTVILSAADDGGNNSTKVKMVTVN